MSGPPKRSRLLPIALATIAIILIVGAFEFSNPGQTVQSTQTGSPSSQVSTDFSNHLDKVEGMNISSIEQDYQTNATAVLYSTGQGSYYGKTELGAGNLSSSGNFTGRTEIGRMFNGVFLSDFIIPHFSNVKQNVTVVGSVAKVNSTFEVIGTNVDGSSLYASVSTQATYVKTDGQWLISYEVWNFTDVSSHG